MSQDAVDVEPCLDGSGRESCDRLRDVAAFKGFGCQSAYDGTLSVPSDTRLSYAVGACRLIPGFAEQATVGLRLHDGDRRACGEERKQRDQPASDGERAAEAH